VDTAKDPNMSIFWFARLRIVVAGAISGLLAAVVMTLAMAASRFWLGIMPPPEAVPDRIAPLLDIDTFFSLFSKYGGYNGLKQFGILSGLRGIAVTGLVVGILYAIVAELPASRRSARRIAPPDLFLVAASLMVWVGFVVFLWPVLPANYRGLPYTWARVTSIVALAVWIAVFAIVLALAWRWMTRRDPAPASEEERPTPPLSRIMISRAALLTGVGGLLLLPIHRMLKTMYDDATFTYDGRQYTGDVQPVAPNDRFYTVTKNVVDPDIRRGLWRLEIGGHVASRQSFSFDDLAEFEQVDQETTLCCISNRIGAGLISNANWRGVRLPDLLNAAGVKDGAYEVFVTGADAYTDSFPIAKALEETTLVVYQMNGEELPREHGYPVRLIVPGLYGEKNVKWVSRIDVVTSDRKGFYEQQGWGPTFVPPTRSDIFTPAYINRRGVGYFFRDTFRRGRTVHLKGRAYAGDRGVRSVDVSVDNGTTWSPAELTYQGNDLSWSLWQFEWTPATAGEHVILSRAVDGTGTPQPGDAVPYIPDGAGGYHIVRATVE
jgi:DMSO/TMAO reductase YedYZ molybdopterin-dependent catalytic subunit